MPLLNGFLHVFIRSYTKERGNAHSSPTYSLWSLKWESPARNRMKGGRFAVAFHFVILTLLE
ncbi:Ribose ABC transport system periplasmic ribose-binding protein RbsB [Geobacillus stearothermophilus]|uniref:Ribose ABC transport system periplasmic ribose-binding protein RbsB n=1 Tax=Geobacillus stearothermophilus TaxID=1422 RepID=A0ABQ7HJ67_GEOSE|nr:Ribose ABC transport system periplasmic ribose-binding protein RbsB [Geobacillus stearothermophilus]